MSNKPTHKQRVDHIIDTLEDVEYQLACKPKGEDGTQYPRHLVKFDEWKPFACGISIVIDTDLDYYDIDPDEEYGIPDDICKKCLKLIQATPTRFGFHATGINLVDESHIKK